MWGALGVLKCRFNPTSLSSMTRFCGLVNNPTQQIIIKMNARLSFWRNWAAVSMGRWNIWYQKNLVSKKYYRSKEIVNETEVSWKYLGLNAPINWNLPRVGVSIDRCITTCLIPNYWYFINDCLPPNRSDPVLTSAKLLVFWRQLSFSVFFLSFTFSYLNTCTIGFCVMCIHLLLNRLNNLVTSGLSSMLCSDWLSY